MTGSEENQTEAHPEARNAGLADWDTLVLGLGNLLYADEGFGVRAVEALQDAWELPGHVRIMDGGTQGLFLTPFVSSAKSLLIFDAIDFGLEPGELRVITGDDVPRFMGVKKVSMHQTSFQEVLATADLAGNLPERLALVGVQPDTFDDYGGSLRPVVRARLDEAVQAGIAVLAEWGIEARPLADGEASDSTAHEAITLERYERKPQE
ncbi:MAG: HyaD/HybD family hydrogenase maturation endopeptidase, partial [Gammaproteobacteria bacterium]